MKRFISVLLAALLILLLPACADVEEQPVETTEAPPDLLGRFTVGCAVVEITPRESMPLAGYGRSGLRMSNGMLSYLYAGCVAITDPEGSTVILCSLDLYDTAHADRMRTVISEAAGVPVENVMVSATYTHSAPDLTDTEYPAVRNYLNLLDTKLAEAARKAMHDRKTATLSGGSIQTSGLTYVRHYQCNDGTYTGELRDNGRGYAQHAHEADAVLQLIRITRRGGKDIYLTNFQTQPNRTGGEQQYDLSADVVGEYRRAMEEMTGAQVLYFSGACGNLEPTSRIAEENVTVGFRSHGEALARFALHAELMPLETGKVQVTTQSFRATVDHTWDTMAATCGKLYDRWNTGEIEEESLLELSRELGLTVNSPAHAAAISTRAARDAAETFEISAYSFGEVAFVAAPGGLFDDTGVSIREGSPFGMTFIATNGNGDQGYFPSKDAFRYSSHEVDVTRYVAGTAEELADQYVAMLKAMQ